MEDSPEIKMDNSAEIDAIKRQKALVSAQIELEQMKFELYDLRAAKNRGRSISVGAACGGTIEISMRGDADDMYVQLQPTEAVEFLNSLAAQCGLDIATRPKEDYATWRSWDPRTLPERTHVGLGAQQLHDQAREKLIAQKETELAKVRVEEPEKPLLPETNESK